MTNNGVSIVHMKNLKEIVMRSKTCISQQERISVLELYSKCAKVYLNADKHSPRFKCVEY